MIPNSWLVALAVLMAACVRVAEPVVSAAVVGVLVVAALVLERRRSALIICACLVCAVAVRSAVDLSGLSRAIPTGIEADAELAGDPEAGKFGTRVTMIVDGRRWAGEVDREHEHVLRGALMGDRFLIRGTPKRFESSAGDWVLSQHLSGRLRVKDISVAGPTRPWFRWANWFHRTLTEGASSMTQEQRSLYLGLVIGDDRGQDDLTTHRFRVSGLAHLLAVSGQNLVFVFAVLMPLSSRIPFRGRWVLGVSATALFVLITRAEPSVMRAATMALLALSASVAGRRVTAVRLVALTVVGLLLADPLLVHSVGFQLSVGATLGLVIFSGPLIERLPGPGFLTRPVAVTLAAQAGAILPMAAAFGVTSVVTVPANAFAEPAAGAVMTLGLTTGLLAGLVRHPFDAVLQAPVAAMVSWIDLVATKASQLSIPPLEPHMWGLLAAGAAASLWLWNRLGMAAVGRSAMIPVAAMVILLRPGSLRPPFEVMGLPVGEDPCGHSTLEVDVDSIDVLGELWKLGVTRIDEVTSHEESTSLAQVADQLGSRITLLEESAVGREERDFGRCSLAE